MDKNEHDIINEAIKKYGIISTTYLQRKLKISYQKAQILYKEYYSDPFHQYQRLLHEKKMKENKKSVKSFK